MERSNIVIMTEDDDIVIQDDKRIFSTGATKNISKGKGRFDLIPCEALVALARRFEFGVENGHEENGYRKGIPNNVLFDSAMRHLVQAMNGEQDEDHLAAVMWNVSVLIYNREQEIQNFGADEAYFRDKDYHISKLFGNSDNVVKQELSDDKNN